MKVKTLAILLIVLAVLTGLVFVVFMQRSHREGKRELGAPLFKKFPANDIAALTIVDAGDEGVHLARRKGGWVVENRFGYPADFQKITEFVRKLRDVKVGRSFEATEGVVKRLHLREPGTGNAPKEEQGTAVIFADEKGKTLARVLMGAPMKGGQGGMFPEGQYVLLNKGKTVYLVNKQFEGLEKTPSRWLKKDLVDVKAADVREVACLDPDGKTTRFVLRRPAKGKDLEQVYPAPGKRIKRSAVNRLAGALSGLHIEDVLDPGKKGTPVGLKKSPKLVYRLFSGMVYELYPGKKCKEAGSCYLTVRVRYEQPAPSKDLPKGEGTGKKKEAPGSRVKEEADNLDKKLSPWVYVIPQWKHDALITDFQLLLEKEKKE